MDRLFREGADKYELKPSAAAWDAIQGQAGAKTSVWPSVWKVAAAIVVLISSVLVLFNWKGQSTESLAGVIDHPQQTEGALAWTLPEVKKAFVQVEAVEAQVAAEVQVGEEQQGEMERIDILASEARPFLELQSISVTWEIKMPTRPALFNAPQEESRITIRYYASASEPEKTKKGFGQFIARAQQKLSPDELLADIRTAKDDLFRGNRGD